MAFTFEVDTFSEEVSSIETEQWVVNPGVSISKRASDIHGITNERAQSEGIDPAASADRCADIIASAAKDGIGCVIYNADFDLGILKFELARYGLPNISERLGRKFIEVIDPLVLDKVLDPYRKGSRKLENVAEHYGIPVLGEYHHASTDAMIASEIAANLFEKYDIIRNMNCEELYEFQKQYSAANMEQYNAWALKNGKPTRSSKWFSVKI